MEPPGARCYKLKVDADGPDGNGKWGCQLS
ncbi:hypothetical protein A2U01_0102840 [Trifolium medium]|uniref:Uncharacterized protein n=1 Tax=Trifolium medium TaxID=97028 RepID=A0A392UZY1_9FABA|nr:hypothetical protein [Trifolium medium]